MLKLLIILEKVNLVYTFLLLCLISVVGLSGCALQKELPPARDQSEINTLLDQAIVQNESLPQTSEQKNIALKSEQEIVLDALLPPLTRSKVNFNNTSEQEERFNIAVNELPAKQFFMGLVEDSDTNIIVHPQVTGNITLNLKNVSVSDVLMIAKKVYGFDYQMRGHNYFISPNTLQTRLFQINYINLKRTGSSNIDVSSGQISKEEDNFTDSSNNGINKTRVNTKFGTQLKTEFEGDLWQELSLSLRTLIGAKEGRDIIINPQTGIVLVKAMPDELLRVKEFLQATQMISARQVLLEAKIVEVELSDAFQAGISWGAIGYPSTGKTIVGAQDGIGSIASRVAREGISTGDTNIGSIGLNTLSSQLAGPFGGVFALALDLNDFKAMIELLGTQGNVQILSSPRIATMNNQKAVIKVGTDRFFVTDLNSSNTSNYEGSASQIPDVELTPFFSGVALDVTPQIAQQGEIILHIHPSISNVTEEERSIRFSDDLAISLPMAKSTIRESDSIIRARNGQMVIIGGLMSTKSTDDNSSVPFFGDIPIIGNAFKHQRELTVKSELVIMLKATYLEDEKIINDTLRQTQERFQQLDNYDVSGRPSTEKPSSE